MFLPALYTLWLLLLFSLQCSLSSSEEERFISIRRPKTPTSNDFSDLNTQTNWTKSLPLPTPEEKMRQQAQTVQADVVPINITGTLCQADTFRMYLGEWLQLLLYAVSISLLHQRWIAVVWLHALCLLKGVKLPMWVHITYLLLVGSEDYVTKHWCQRTQWSNDWS